MNDLVSQEDVSSFEERADQLTDEQILSVIGPPLKYIDQSENNVCFKTGLIVLNDSKLGPHFVSQRCFHTT